MIALSFDDWVCFELSILGTTVSSQLREVLDQIAVQTISSNTWNNFESFNRLQKSMTWKQNNEKIK